VRPPNPISSPGQPPGDRYSFGDNPTAERRLHLLAGVFAPTSDALLKRLHGDTTGLVLDLGCGPGLTTRMLARHLPDASVVGLDSSAVFVAGAGSGGSDEVRFVVHDVTVMPLPGAPAAVIYARFLLAHLPDPTAVVEAWVSQLGPAGVLIMEEVEWIRTDETVFANYLELMTGVLRARQTELYVGPLLGRLVVPSAYAMIQNDVAYLSPTVADAAGLFSLNLATVRHDASVAKEHTEAELDSLARSLEARLDGQHVGSITWGMRQVIVQRR
jgi:SAM-dependent methyltransferase